MIPAAFITEWRARVPWPESQQVEQDLILSRLMVEIASNEILTSGMDETGASRRILVARSLARVCVCSASQRKRPSRRAVADTYRRERACVLMIEGRRLLVAGEAGHCPLSAARGRRPRRAG